MEENFNEETNLKEEEKYEYPSETLKHSRSENLENEKLNEDDYAKDKQDNFSVIMGRKTRTFLISALAVLLILVIFLVSYIIYSFGVFKDFQSPVSLMNTSEENPHVSGESEIKFENSVPEGELSAESIYDIVSPSVVGVVVYDSYADIISDPTSEGSGIVISEKGYIVTNSHVVGNSKQNNIKIVLNTGEEFSGKVLGYDSKTDLAVIKTDKTGLKAATFGNSDEVKVGASALALGNPLGLNFASSLTRGIVSAINRSANGGPKSLVKYIQTDAAINPGNSGGPLINMRGQIIGINSTKIAVAHCEGMGFAIPSNTVKTIVDDIIDKGYVSGRVRLGMTGKMVSNYQAQIYNVPVGLIVSEINSDSNLGTSGVKVGDIITKINGVSVTSFDAFYSELYNHKAGEKISLSIFRPSRTRMNSETFDVNVVLLEDKGETQQESISKK
ncbi:MAG: trypsin-like peptidase domain-containing protein [Clostridia bacterium]|nr:trypsin-like peptidase domain-containing protein [Clostridia bacterium]